MRSEFTIALIKDIWRSNKEILVYTGVLPCLVPSWLQIMQIRISFRSRSDLVLDADHALDFSYLVLQACISFCSKMRHLCFCPVRMTYRCSCEYGFLFVYMCARMYMPQRTHQTGAKLLF